MKGCNLIGAHHAFQSVLMSKPSYIHVLFIVKTNTYKPLKEHETLFHDNPNCITTFEFDRHHLHRFTTGVYDNNSAFKRTTSCFELITSW